jgi:ankyrin repeat protein
MTNSIKYLQHAEQKNWDHIRMETIKGTDLLAQDDRGETLLHKAVHQNKLYLIPPHFLKDEYLSIRNKNGENIYFYATKTKEFKLIPKSLITKEKLLEENDKGESLLYKIISYQRIEELPPQVLTLGILQETCKPTGTTYLNYCAMQGEIKKIGSEHYQNKLWDRDDSGKILAHFLASGDSLDVISSKDGAHDLMLAQDKYGQTPLHEASDLSQVPPNLLTRQALGTSDWKGQSPIFKSTWLNCTKNLPLDLLSSALLTQEDYKGRTPLENILSDFTEEEEKDVTQILLLLKKETLEEMLLKIKRSQTRRLLKQVLAKGKLSQNLSKDKNIMDL